MADTSGPTVHENGLAFMNFCAINQPSQAVMIPRGMVAACNIVKFLGFRARSRASAVMYSASEP